MDISLERVDIGDVTINDFEYDSSDNTLTVDCSATVSADINSYDLPTSVDGCDLSINEVIFRLDDTDVKKLLTDEAIDSYSIDYAGEDLNEVEDFAENVEDFEWDKEKIANLIQNLDLNKGDSETVDNYENVETIIDDEDIYCEVEMSLDNSDVADYLDDVDNGNEVFEYEIVFNGNVWDYRDDEGEAIDDLRDMIVRELESGNNVNLDDCYVESRRRYMTSPYDWDSDYEGVVYNAEDDDYYDEYMTTIEYASVFNGNEEDYFDDEDDARDDVEDRIREAIDDGEYEDIDFDECYVSKIWRTRDGDRQDEETVWTADEDDYERPSTYNAYFNNDMVDSNISDEDEAISIVEDYIQDYIDDNGGTSGIDFDGCYVERDDDLETVWTASRADYESEEEPEVEPEEPANELGQYGNNFPTDFGDYGDFDGLKKF